MKTYADTSLLFSLYATDSNSDKADIWRQANPAPLIFNSFHRLELRNALQSAVFRKKMTANEADAVWMEVEQDVAMGLLIPQENHWSQIMSEAELYAKNHTADTGCRTLDVLHLAVAKVSGASEFCTFDKRQSVLAGRIGLMANLL